MRNTIRRVAIGLSCAIVLAAGGVSAHGPGGKPSAAFQAYQKDALPDVYKGVKNPLAPSAENTAAGLRLYRENCAACHGIDAMGNGPMAKDMDVKPANLRRMLMHYPNADDYYAWIIGEGGNRFGLPMPGFVEVLSKTEIWQLVTWMQAGFPGAAKPNIGHQPGQYMGGRHKRGGHMGKGHMMGQDSGMQDTPKPSSN